MTKKQKQSIVAAILVAAMVFVWIKQFQSTGSANASTSQLATPAASTAKPAVADKGPTPAARPTADPPAALDPQIEEAQRLRRQMPWRRDPFHRPVRVPAPAVRFHATVPGSSEAPADTPPAVEFPAKLGAILYSPNNPMVVLDGQVLSVGDRTADGARVAKITRHSVTLEKLDQSTVLSLEDL